VKECTDSAARSRASAPWDALPIPSAWGRMMRFVLRDRRWGIMRRLLCGGSSPDLTPRLRGKQAAFYEDPRNTPG